MDRLHTPKLWTLVCLGLASGAAACGGDDITLPSEGQAAHIEVVAGNNQSAPANSQLQPVVVKVTDSRGRLVVGAPVEFSLGEGSEGASITPTSAPTGPDGLASATITLGTQVGQMTGQAKLAGEDVTAGFVATALPSNANIIQPVSGDLQAGPVGSTLEAPLVVRVTDTFGNPIPNVTIAWSVTGGGSVSEETTQTGSDGQTSVQRTLGSTAGQQTTLASAQGLVGSPVTFTHTATAGNAARVRVVSGNGQQATPGTQLPEPLVVQVLDADNNPIPGRAVTWIIGEGGGSVSPETSTTDGQGMASSQWTLGPGPGRNTVSAVVSGVGVAGFNATASKASSSVAIVSHQPEPSAPGQGVVVQVQVTGSAGTPSGTVTVTGDGAAPCTITLAGGTGTCTLTFGSPGNRSITAMYSGDAIFNGNSAEVNHRVEVANGAPTAAFEPPSCTAGQPCQFTDGSSDDGNIVSWNWSFGDGGSSNAEDPSHVYGTAGSFSVTLTVTDDKGATNSVTHNVNVAAAPPPNSPPSASFTHADCTAGVECQFNDTSTDDKQIVSWHWDFGDFTSPSNAQNPTHSYTVGAGFPYQVTLTVTDNEGATSSVTQTVTVQ
jgi:PKD repeat protein